MMESSMSVAGDSGAAAAVAAAGVERRRDVERLCRLCATITTHPNQRVDIFAVDGLPAMIETCLPVRVLKESLLPDTLCTSCNDKITAFIKFRKRSLETLKILEENFHVTQTCFTKPTPAAAASSTTAAAATNSSEQSTMTENLDAERTQFDEWRTKQLATFHYEGESYSSREEHRRKLQSCAMEIQRAEATLAAKTTRHNLVQYDSSSCSSSESDTDDRKTDADANATLSMSLTTYRKKLYFDDKVNDIITEICERKSTKRKLEALFAPSSGGRDENASRAKLFKPDARLNLTALCSASSRRKKRPPAKRLPLHTLAPPTIRQHVSILPLPAAIPTIPSALPPPPPAQKQQLQLDQLPQVCLLCDQQFPKGTQLAKHVFDTHGIDMAQVLSSEPIPEGMTRTLHANLQTLQLQQTLALQPPLADEMMMMIGVESPRGGRSPKSGSQSQGSSAEKKKKLPELVKITDLKTKRESIEKVPENDAPPTLTASYVCPLCPASLTNKTDLYAHLRVRHAQHAKLICGLCLHIATSLATLQEHLDTCAKSHTIQGYFVCQVCKYAEDNQKSLENHILVHEFLLADCKKDGKIFDPSDYVDANEACEPKFYSCTECGSSLQSFKEYSSHKRSEHSIFHCDLCNKSYGRNSHLWKHVNRVHKGHPSVTCQFCYKTSASKYHLLQHFNKIHTQKVPSGSALSGLNLLTSSAAPSSGQKVKNGDVLSEFEEDDFMMKKFDPFDFQSVRQSFMRAEMEAKKSQGQGQESESTPSKVVKLQRNTELRDLSSLKMPTVPPKELDSSSTIYTNIITNYTPPTNDGEYKCPKCSKAFHKRTLLKKHKKNCRPRLQKDLLTRCKSCSRIFKDRQSLAKHLVNYHSEYSCEMCDEKVQSKCEIVSHIRFTHPGSHLNCRDCGNVLRNNDLLRAHLQDHANSFVCQFCGDILPSKIKLKMHILSLHRKILSLSCGVCLKLFESQHILRDHVRMVHREALQPLTSCTVCGKNYGSKWKTYDHLNKSHGRVFRACKVCLEVFNNEQELQAHVDAHHSKGMKKYTPEIAALAQYDQQHLSVKKEEDEDDVDEGGGEEEGESEEEDDSSDVRVKDEFEGKSILEKHLVGAYVHNRNNNSQLAAAAAAAQAAQHAHGQAQQAKQQNGLNTTPKNVRHHPEELINSSKRTVYVNSNDPSVCDICHKNWPAKKHLWQHYIRCHKQVAATVCGICLSTNKSYADLQRHLNTEHPTLLHGKGFGSNFICRICGRYHNASSKLKLHMAIHIKFDWSLLDNPQPLVESIKQESVDQQDVFDDDDGEEDDDDDEEEEEEEEVPQKFKFKVKIKPIQKKPPTAEGDERVNYESMIEQVECSTNSSSSSESEEGEEEGEEVDDNGEVEGDGEVTGNDGEEVDDDDEDEDDEGEDGEDVEEEEAEDEEQNISQVEDEVEDEQEEIELSDDEEGEEDDEGEEAEDAEGEEYEDEDDDDDDDEDMEEVQEIKALPVQEEQVEAHLQKHHQQLTEEGEDVEEVPDEDVHEGDYQADEDPEELEDASLEAEEQDAETVEEEEYEHEYEEVVEEVVHPDDHITIYEQEEIIEDAYLESDVDGTEDVEVDEQGHIVTHIITQDGGDDESSMSEEINYEQTHVTYVQHLDDEEDCEEMGGLMVEEEAEGEEEEQEDVDTAVQSICYEEDSLHDGQVAEEYEVQSTNAPLNNQHEIQNAVDSIL